MIRAICVVAALTAGAAHAGTVDFSKPPTPTQQAAFFDAVGSFVVGDVCCGGATVTPTIFINGVRYRSYKDPLWLIDACEYAASRHATAASPSRR
jgi:hypothetical protein